VLALKLFLGGKIELGWCRIKKARKREKLTGLDWTGPSGPSRRPHFVRESLVKTNLFIKQCTQSQLHQSLSLGDNGRAFPSQTTAEGQEDEQ
jgi:hypothetical protein